MRLRKSEHAPAGQEENLTRLFSNGIKHSGESIIVPKIRTDTYLIDAEEDKDMGACEADKEKIAGTLPASG